jgi:hypothetical protein
MVTEFGPYRTLHNLDDYRRTSDGRLSHYERVVDAVSVTECAGDAARAGAFLPGIIACLYLSWARVDNS